MRGASILFAASVVLASLYSCSPDRHTAGPATKWTQKNLEKTYGICDTANTPCVKVRLTYPELQPGVFLPLRDSLQRYINAAMYGSVVNGAISISFDSLASEIVSEYRLLQEEFSDYAVPRELERKITIITDTAAIVSLRFEEFSFLGGAHPMQTVHYSSFDASTGRQLSLNDLFTTGHEADLGQKVAQEFRRVRQVPDSQNLTDAGFWIEEGKFPTSRNFAIGVKHIVFYYNPYEVAPYAWGPTEVHVPLETLQAIIERKGPLGGLLAR